MNLLYKNLVADVSSQWGLQTSQTMLNGVYNTDGGDRTDGRSGPPRRCCRFCVLYGEHEQLFSPPTKQGVTLWIHNLRTSTRRFFISGLPQDHCR